MILYKYSDEKGIGRVRILVSALILVIVFETISILWLIKNKRKEKDIDEMIRFSEICGENLFFMF